MQTAHPSKASPTVEEIQRLNGKLVLVRSSRDQRNPPTARRGTIEVRDNPGASPEVALALEFPQMYTMQAHRRTIPLDAAGVRRLLDAESNGTFEFTIDDELT
jgi:hypothetical protein